MSISVPLTNGMNLGVMVLRPRHTGVQPCCPAGAQPCWQGEDELMASKAGHPFFPFRAVVLQVIPLPGASGCRRLWTFQLLKTTDQGWMIFWKGKSPGSSPLHTISGRELATSRLRRGLGKVRDGSLVPGPCGFEPSLPFLGLQTLSWKDGPLG